MAAGLVATAAEKGDGLISPQFGAFAEELFLRGHLLAISPLELVPVGPKAPVVVQELLARTEFLLPARDLIFFDAAGPKTHGQQSKTVIG